MLAATRRTSYRLVSAEPVGRVLCPLVVERMKGIEEQPVQQGSRKLLTMDMTLYLTMWAFPIKTGEQVLKDVSFTARQGQVTALVGPSGEEESPPVQNWRPGSGTLTRARSPWVARISAGGP